MEEKLVNTVILANNLKLNFYDESRKIAEGRYYVSLIIRIDIAVKPEMFLVQETKNPTYDEIIAAIGKDMIVFEQKRERNFISASEREDIFQEMCDTIMNHSTIYYARDDFPKKFILSEYKKIISR